MEKNSHIADCKGHIASSKSFDYKEIKTSSSRRNNLLLDVYIEQSVELQSNILNPGVATNRKANPRSQMVLQNSNEE